MSEHTLDELIAKVKSEAIEAAEKEAQQIIDDAKSKEKQLLSEAESQKEKLINDAKLEAQSLIEKGKIALNQAARDVYISVKNDILKLLKSALETEVEEAFTPELYSSIITKIIDNIGTNITIALPDQIQDQLLKSIQKKLATSKNTLKIIKKEQLLSGLSLTQTDEGWSYDITAEEISELLSQHLNSKWAELLNNK